MAAAVAYIGGRRWWKEEEEMEGQGGGMKRMWWEQEEEAVMRRGVIPRDGFFYLHQTTTIDSFSCIPFDRQRLILTSDVLDKGM